MLKYFGIGATIVPVLGGVPEIATPAKLIEIPTIEPALLISEPYPLRGVFMNRERVTLTVDAVTASGKHHRFRADSFVVSQGLSFPVDGRATWEMKGTVLL